MQQACWILLELRTFPLDNRSCSSIIPNRRRYPWQCGVVQNRHRLLCCSSSLRQNHYSVLGIPLNASSTDIKKAYRHLALKFHPDVSKESQAGETFKSIRLAYDTLSNEMSRKQYDKDLIFHENNNEVRRRSRERIYEYEDGNRMYKWSDLRERMQDSHYKQRYKKEMHSFYYEESEEHQQNTNNKTKSPFIDVLRCALLSLFLMKTVGCRMSITCSSLMAFLDVNLDAGYKVGYLIAWVLGGRVGVLLTLCFAFASFFCGKNSSSSVCLVVVAVWVSSHMLRYFPMPQGAILTLLYMSIKLQTELR
ncbi:dnaJ homolog subfamily C member 18 [Impatiens glandulifera]|uniref:dnaJ homolog subfamily C member 18 n=1 Tax=Impatiens glandulifera TaxID=253017 RepID=UPI001FB0E6F2|nr:dnaJ homolog subfamily C member 18 [Impatiens glandulifera]